MKTKKLIVSKHHVYEQPGIGGPNHNTIVMGAPGTGKSRNVVKPNLINMEGSFIINDSKGALYEEFKEFFNARGYKVCCLDFSHPGRSGHYNLFKYIRNEYDILRIAHMITYNDCVDSSGSVKDPFWDKMAEQLFIAYIAFMVEFLPENLRTLEILNHLASCPTDYVKYVCPDTSRTLNIEERIRFCPARNNNNTDKLFEIVAYVKPESYCLKAYRKVADAPERTYTSIISIAFSKLGQYDTAPVRKMTGSDDVDLRSIGDHNTAFFVCVSDSDRSMDILANIFYTQVIQELMDHADNECPGRMLPVGVQLIFDDFATSVKIDDFPRMIAAFRSRGISSMLLLQCESQLSAYYGEQDAKTIIASCSTYIYLGGMDVATAKSMSERMNIPLNRVLSLPYGRCLVHHQGEASFQDELYDPTYLERKAADLKEGKLPEKDVA